MSAPRPSPASPIPSGITLSIDRVAAVIDAHAPKPDDPSIDIVAFGLASARLISDPITKIEITLRAADIAARDNVDPDAAMAVAKKLEHRITEALAAERLLASL